MLLTEEVEVNVGRNLVYYENLGYEIPKYLNCKNELKVKKGTKIIVKVSDLKVDSISNVEVKCDYCENIYTITYKSYNKSKKEIINKDCCKHCGKFKRRESNLLKYGEISHMKTEKYKNMFSKKYKNIKEEFIKRGYELVSKEYVHSSQKLDFICDKHIDKGIQTISWTHFNRGYGCKYCGYERVSKKMKGENNVNWNGGISSLSHYLRNFIDDWKITL